MSPVPDLKDEVSDLHGDVAVVSDHLAEALVPFLQVEYLRHGGGVGDGSRLPLRLRDSRRADAPYPPPEKCIR